MRVDVTLLDGFSVVVDGRRVDERAWARRNAAALVKVLALRPGRRLPREQLIDLLWPDELEPPGKLGARLSVQLSTVRRILGGGVIADRDSIRIDPDVVQIDVVELDRAARNNDFEAVARYYTGTFLPEDQYDDWTTNVRARTRASFATAAKHLIAAAQATGQLDCALQHALAWLDSDLYDHNAHHALITTYLALGQHCDAHRAHHSYQQRMLELGVTAPSLDTLATS
jgi:DNA-binding SARP family transcriptional activator